MAFTRPTDADRLKESWRVKLKPLEEKFHLVKPVKGLESPDELAKWEEWEKQIIRRKLSISIYSKNDGGAYLNITHLLEGLKKYINKRILTQEILSAIQRDQRVMKKVAERDKIEIKEELMIPTTPPAHTCSFARLFSSSPTNDAPLEPCEAPRYD